MQELGALVGKGSEKARAALGDALSEREERLRERRAEVHEGWGDKYIERVHNKGKLTSRERHRFGSRIV